MSASPRTERPPLTTKVLPALPTGGTCQVLRRDAEAVGSHGSTVHLDRREGSDQHKHTQHVVIIQIYTPHDCNVDSTIRHPTVGESDFAKKLLFTFPQSQQHKGRQKHTGQRYVKRWPSRMWRPQETRKRFPSLGVFKRQS